MEGAGLALGIVATVIEVYKVVERAYDIYLGIKEFRSTYHELHLCMEIERFRLKLWGDHMLSEGHLEEIQAYQNELKLFELFDSILERIYDELSESNLVMSGYSEQNRNERSNSKRNSTTRTEDVTGDKSRLFSTSLPF